MNISTSGNAFQQAVSGSLQDGKVNRAELSQLQTAVNQTDASEADKKNFMALAESVSQATSKGLFRSEDISPGEMRDIAQKAEALKDSPLGHAFMGELQKNTDTKNPIVKLLLAIFEGLAKAVEGGGGRQVNAQTSSADFNAFRSAVSDANSMSFPEGSGTQYDSSFSSSYAADPVSGVSGVAPQVDMFGDNVFVPQFSEGTAKERQANCGPASAAMMISALGVNPPPDMSEIRASVGARTGNGGGPFAISTSQLIRAVEKSTGKSGVTSNLPVSANTAGKEIAQRLEAGKNVIILTGGMGGSSGHYMMVKGVEFDSSGNIKSLTVDDPGSSNGENRVISGAKLQQIMSNRSAAGKVNQLLTF